jgi:hypothetical protein
MWAWLLLVTVLAACVTFGEDRVEVRGSGRLISESRDVSGFEEVALLGFGDVIIEMTGSESLTIDAEDNILPLLTSEVVAGRLELGVVQNSRQSLSPTRDVVFRVTADQLVGVSVAGSGNVTVSELQVDTFTASISGSGNVTPLGRCDSVKVDIRGSGNYAGENMVARSGSVSVGGSGNVIIHATEELTVSISGSGTVEYLGSPTLTRSISGSGEIIAR